MGDEMTATVYANGGLWVAMCPYPGCYNAEAEGRNLGEGFRCSVCNTTCRAVWPANRADIAAVLMQRPAPITRNWVPGETIADLVAENVAHGIWPVTAEMEASAPVGKVWQLSGDTFEVGPAALEAGLTQLQIGRG